MMSLHVNNSRTSKNSILQICTYLLALVGVGTIVSGALPKTYYELDHGAYIAMVRSTWWGIKKNRYHIRLQHHLDWKHGRPYLPPPRLEEYDWFIKDENNKWYPMDFVGPPDIQDVR